MRNNLDSANIECAYTPESLENINGEQVGFCPICHREVWGHDDFCPRCGTHILWGKANESGRTAPLTIRDCREMIHFVKSYKCDEYGTTTLYFSAPPDVLIGDEFAEATSAIISVEFPADHPEYFYAADGSVMMSPVFKPDTGLLWMDVNLPYEDIDALLEIFDQWRRYAGVKDEK